MRSSIVHAKYLVSGSKNSGVTIVEDGALYEEDGTIKDVGPYRELRPRYPGAVDVGGSELVALPGLVNSHHHGRGWTTLQMGNFDQCIELRASHRWGKLRRVDPYLHALYTGLRMIETGTTTISHMHTDSSPEFVEGDLNQVLKAYRAVGLRVAVSFTIRDQNFVVHGDEARFLAKLPAELRGPVEQRIEGGRFDPDRYFELLERLHHAHAREGLVRMYVAPTSVHWCTDDLLMRCKEFAKRMKTGIHIHLQETMYERIYGPRVFGKSPLAHLADIGFVGPEVVCGHGVWLDTGDIEILKSTGASVCHLPSSNLRLHSGVAPVVPLLDGDVSVSLGTDSTGLNDDDDMFQEMRLALNLHRLPGVESRSVSASQVFRMATVEGARATFSTETGSLEKGKRADVVLLRLADVVEPYLDDDVDIVSAIVGRAKGTDVDTVIVNGEVVVARGRSNRADRAEIRKELSARLRESAPAGTTEGARLAAAIRPYVVDHYRDWRADWDPFYQFNSRS